MCIAIYNPITAEELPKYTLETCRENNSDGMGLAWAYDGKLYTYKTMENFEAFYNVYKAVRKIGVDIALHFRIATHGSVTVERCHPFMVGEAEGGLAVIHNGIIGSTTPAKDDVRSDTEIFCQEVLSHLPAGELVRNFYLVEMLEDFIGTYNKVIVLHSSGESVILNRQQGETVGDNWFSNDSYKYHWKRYQSYTYRKGGLEELWWWAEDMKGYVCDACATDYKMVYADSILTLRRNYDVIDCCSWCSAIPERGTHSYTGQSRLLTSSATEEEDVESCAAIDDEQCGCVEVLGSKCELCEEIEEEEKKQKEDASVKLLPKSTTSAVGSFDKFAARSGVVEKKHKSNGVTM